MKSSENKKLHTFLDMTLSAQETMRTTVVLLCIHYHVNAFTEPLPSKDRKIYT